jgi:uncharacterized membrane protein YfcA
MLLSYIHPVIGALVLALLAYVASLGARSINDPRNAAAWRARHARLAPWAAVAVFATGLLGLLTTWLLRPKLHVSESGHFKVVTALLGLVSASAISSRWMDHKAVRAVHPWFGVAGLLIAAAVFFFGLQITP